MMLSDIQHMTPVKANILETLHETPGGEHASTLIHQHGPDPPVIAHNLNIMHCDGWIQKHDRRGDDVLLDITATGEDLLDLVEFGDTLNQRATEGDTR